MPPSQSIDFQRVFRSVPGLYLLLRVKPNFEIVDVSDEYLSATNKTRAELIGIGVFDAFPPAPHEAHTATMRNLRLSLDRVVATGLHHKMEIQKYDLPVSRAESGAFEERYWQPINSPVLSSDGDVEYVVHCVEDCTALLRSRQGEMLARSRVSKELRATDILESITEGFFSIDRNWRFTFANKESELILGKPATELVGRIFWDEYPGVLGSHFEPVYRNAMELRQTGSLTDYYPDHDRWYEVRTYPAPDGIAVYFRNVTGEKRAQQEHERIVALADRERLIYEAAISNTPDFLYVIDLNHQFMWANKALLTMWGVDDPRGKTWAELGYEKWHADMHDNEIDRVIGTRQPIRGEVPFTGTHGRRIYDYIFAPVLDEAGNVVAVAGTTRDVTERQQTEQAIREQAVRLRETDRAKDEFLATLAHELRNPLAPLRNSLTMLRMPHDAAIDMAPVHDMMERQVNHLVRLVDDLLEMSRVSRGTFDLQRERVDVAVVLRNVLETVQPAIDAAEHRLTVYFPPQPLWVNADSTRLAQVFANVLNNAVTYTERGGRINVAVRQQGNDVLIAVKDNGTGIAPGQLQRMFEMFSRGGDARSRVQGGLGIGLALARRLTEMHDGTLTAHSLGLGKGSEFTVKLPMSSAPNASSTQYDTAPDDTISHHRILIVDDNVDAATSLGVILEKLGADVSVTSSGAEALSALPDYSPTVVLLDIGMPEMDGYEVARTIRRDFPSENTSLIALTGWGQERDRQLAREAGFDYHLTKPADLKALQALLASLGNSGMR